MCGIVGAVAERDIVPVLIEGLRRLEYRGYDSAGVAVVRDDGSVGLSRTVGKVAELDKKLADYPALNAYLEQMEADEGVRRALKEQGLK